MISPIRQPSILTVSLLLYDPDAIKGCSTVYLAVDSVGTLCEQMVVKLRCIEFVLFGQSAGMYSTTFVSSRLQCPSHASPIRPLVALDSCKVAALQMNERGLESLDEILRGFFKYSGAQLPARPI